MITHVFFDLDGTIIDTEPAAAKVMSQVFLDFGQKIETADAQFVAGRTWEVAFDHLFARYPLAGKRSEIEARILDQYRKELDLNLPVVPGSVEAVQKVSSRYPLALVSGSHRREILWSLKKLGIFECFKIILGQEDYPCSKPAPDGYQRALLEIGARPEQTLIFEDSNAGIASARAVGAFVVAIRSTNHFEQDTTLAHQSIEDLRAIDAEWVANWAGPV